MLQKKYNDTCMTHKVNIKQMVSSRSDKTTCGKLYHQPIALSQGVLMLQEHYSDTVVEMKSKSILQLQIHQFILHLSRGRLHSFLAAVLVL